MKENPETNSRHAVFRRNPVWGVGRLLKHAKTTPQDVSSAHAARDAPARLWQIQELASACVRV